MTIMASRVVVVVFDGLRPDMVTPDRMPRLHQFATDGLWFHESRTVFPSVMRVATTSFATGAPPGVHGIVGNAFHQPQIVSDAPLDTSKLDVIAMADAHFGGALVTATSLGEALAGADKTMMAVHGGSPGAAWFLNHRAARNGHWTWSIHGRDGTQTPQAIDDAETILGPAPALDLPRHEVVRYCARVMTDVVLPRAPDLAVMWLPEPDTSFHYREIGSDETRAVMRTADEAFGAVLDAARAMPDGDETLVIALSDHGQLTVGEKLDWPTLIGLEDEVARGEVLVTGGRYGEVRRPDGDEEALRDIAGRLLAEDKVGHVLARDDLASKWGLVPFSAVAIDHERQPDLVFVMRASDAADPHGLPGLGLSTEGVPIGGGMHGGLHHAELANMLALKMPRGRTGEDHGPCGLIDVAPTILAALGVPIPTSVVGRTLPIAGDSRERSRVTRTHAPELGSPVVTWESDGVGYIAGSDVSSLDGRRP